MCSGGLALVSIAAVYAYPSGLFAYAYERDGITLHATKPVQDAAAAQFLGRVAQAMDDSPFGPSPEPLALFATDNDWRTQLFFAIVPKAGGVVYVPLTGSHAFLSGIDVARDRLLKADATINPPRTLTYYAVHELTHLRMAELTGTWRFHQMPHWIREGLPDYVALGPMSDAEIAHVLDWNGTPLGRMQAYGAYPVERAAVTFFVDHLGISAQELMSVDISLQNALGKLRKNDFGGAI